jgi:hypothetical protein
MGTEQIASLSLKKRGVNGREKKGNFCTFQFLPESPPFSPLLPIQKLLFERENFLKIDGKGDSSTPSLWETTLFIQFKFSFSPQRTKGDGRKKRVKQIEREDFSPLFSPFPLSTFFFQKEITFSKLSLFSRCFFSRWAPLPFSPSSFHRRQVFTIQRKRIPFALFLNIGVTGIIGEKRWG